MHVCPTKPNMQTLNDPEICSITYSELSNFHLPTMLYFIGLGLASEKDVSVAGLEVIKKAERVYLESYTAVLLVGKDELVPLVMR